MPKRLIAACDGACKGNPGPASWAWVIADENEHVLRWEAGPLGDATNNVGELTALAQLLDAVDADADLEIRMDSEYAIKAATTWLPGWKAKGWMTASKKPVANRAIIERIDTLLADRPGSVKFVHVRAHQVDGDRLNDLADRAANAAASTQQAASGTTAEQVPEAVDEVVVARRPSKGTARTASKGKPATSERPRTATAKFPGTCSCGKPYAVGEKIALGASGWGHVDCA